MDTRGTHIIIDFWDVDSDLLNSEDYVRDAMVEAASQSKATLLHSYFHKFEPSGITGMLVIAESHLSIHTWPQKGYASVDIYTCGDDCFPEEAERVLKEKFAPKKVLDIKIERGKDKLMVSQHRGV